MNTDDEFVSILSIIVVGLEEVWLARPSLVNIGYVSLAETGKWINDTLINFCGDADRGKLLYKSFYPSYIRAFKDAADASKDTKITSKASTDDYVQKKEFRLLCAYLCLYAIMFDHFARIDGFGAGKGADGVGIEDKSDDRRMSEAEWNAARKDFKMSPFISLKCAARKKDGRGNLQRDGRGWEGQGVAQ